MLGLLLGCGLRRSEVVGLNLDQLQSREGRWVIVNLVGKGARLRTVPVPSWSKELVDAWLGHSGVTDGKVFRQVLKGGMVQPSGVTANVVWYAVKRCAGQAGITNLVLGTGGVSIAALQIAKMMGAAVIATSLSDEKLERVRTLGADHVINYRQVPDWGKRGRDLTRGGVDHVVEAGGPGTLAQSIAAVRVGGHISLIGVLTGLHGEVRPSI